MPIVEAIASQSVRYSREIGAQDKVPCMNKVVCVTDTGWGNSGAEGPDIRMVKPFAISPTRFYQARSGLTIRRISVQGSRAVNYRVTLIKLK